MCLNVYFRANMLNYAHDVLKRLQTLLVISPVSITTNMYAKLLIHACTFKNSESILNEYIWRGDLVVSCDHVQIKQCGFELWQGTLQCILGRDTWHLQCLSPCRCTNGYCQLNAGGNPAMTKHLIHGIVQILLVALCYWKFFFVLTHFLFCLLGQWLSAVAFWWWSGNLHNTFCPCLQNGVNCTELF